MEARRTQPTEIEALVAAIRTKTQELVDAKPGSDDRLNKRVRGEIDLITSQLFGMSAKLDPVLRPDSIFDPADPSTAGRVVSLTLLAQSKHPLSAIPEFYGAGVYAIYYRGKDFEPYSSLSGIDHPIYVGKADPDTQIAKDAIAQGTKLSARLHEHANSIRKAKSTLRIEDFDCRFLVVQTGFQKAAEDHLINFFKPIWNSETKICFGLGKHGDSAKTRGNKRSPWDTIHPGRKWADASPLDQKSRELIIEQIAAHLRSNPPYGDIHQIFERFIADMRQLDTAHFYTPTHGTVPILEADERA